ncbi:ferritin family protein [Candidatus Bipolaricaulota bacterium]|nr:ferritin family protein [Candidatus Bipolaricaulota bacterium]
MAMNVLLTSLRQAMLAERDGVQFYSMAAKQAEDSGAVALFEQLANEEMSHFNALQKEYRSVLDICVWDPNTAWDTPREPGKAGHIFSEDFTRRIQGRHLEMAALSIGILLEKQSYEFYVRQAEVAEDANVKAFFHELAVWEEGHYQMLLKEDEALKEEYWSENRFAPLV